MFVCMCILHTYTHTYKHTTLATDGNLVNDEVIISASFMESFTPLLLPVVAEVVVILERERERDRVSVWEREREILHSLVQ